MANNLVRLLGRNSAEFQRFLNEQTPERVDEILAAERVYTNTCRHDTLELVYAESFLGVNDPTCRIDNTDGGRH